MKMKQRGFYRFFARVFQFLTQHAMRRVFYKIKADMTYRIYGLAGVTNLISTANSDMITELLTWYGASIGKRLYVKTQLLIESSTYQRQNDFTNLTIGDNCFLGKGVFLDITDKLSIKDNVSISPCVKILTHSSVANRPLKKYYNEKFAPVTINEGAWIGCGAVILCGVTIGECSVVSAGAVVLNDVEPFTVVAGNPAKVKKNIENRVLGKT
jgi:acetyltransferase-like isoleucine patch superfamily enzyme